ncbi:YhgE/Pip domain-containing protein [Heyndrickxia sporothermodurans]|uniref:YhgE/Pip domain-containing protein n=1 Tax=Heyndrickxia sporothermodurans TaxID=46224 RepID=UPI001F1AA15A|nr:hypothetical protein [Heyndrickxia sporothermodurans]
MRKVFQIYKNDWVNVFKTPIALFLIIALMILPSLYAWFNLKASWDPYGNTSHIPIAVTNADEGAVLRGKNIDVGKEIVNTLKKIMHLVGHLSVRKKPRMDWNTGIIMQPFIFQKIFQNGSPLS